MSHNDVRFQQRLSLPTNSKDNQVRLVSPKAFHKSWIQQQVTQTRTPITNKKPLLETPDDVDIVGTDFKNANQTNTPQGGAHELSNAKQALDTDVSISTATDSVEKSNPTTNDRNPAVSIVVHNQPVAHNATVSEFDQHELDGLTPIAHGATTTEFAQHELDNLTPVTYHSNIAHKVNNLICTPKTTKSAMTNYKSISKSRGHENSLRNSDTPRLLDLELSPAGLIHNSTPTSALSTANFTMKLARRQSNQTSSRSTVPVANSESDGKGNGEITPISMDWARTTESEAPETVQSCSNANSNTETQLSTITNSIPAIVRLKVRFIQCLTVIKPCANQNQRNGIVKVKVHC